MTEDTTKISKDPLYQELKGTAYFATGLYLGSLNLSLLPLVGIVCLASFFIPFVLAAIVTICRAIEHQIGWDKK